jgi:hypothetical protein
LWYCVIIGAFDSTLMIVILSRDSAPHRQVTRYGPELDQGATRDRGTDG